MSESVRTWGMWLDDLVGPIVVKEMRQIVRGRLTSFMLVGLLLGGMLILGGMMVDDRPVNDLASTSGRTVLGAVTVVLTVLLLLVLPISAGMRLVREYDVENPDLYFITTLSGWKIFFGKWFSTMVLGVWILAAAMPFAWIAWFLRGVDVMDIALAMASLVMVMGFFAALTLLVAALPIASASRRGLIVIMVLVPWLSAMFGVAAMTTARFLIGGTGSSPLDGLLLTSASFSVFGLSAAGLVGAALTTLNTWLVVALVAFGWLVDIGFLLVAGRALLAPPSANKTVWVRVYLLAGLAAGLLASGLSGAADEYLLMWVVRAVGLVGLWFMVAFSQPIRLPRGALARGPRWFPANAVYVLLSQSRIAGVLFCLLLVGGIAAVAEFGITEAGFPGHKPFGAEGVLGWGLMMCLYGFAAATIRDCVFSKKARTSSTGWIMLGLLVMGLLVHVMSMIVSMGGDGLAALIPWYHLVEGDETTMWTFAFMVLVAFVGNYRSVGLGLGLTGRDPAPVRPVEVPTVDTPPIAPTVPAQSPIEPDPD